MSQVSNILDVAARQVGVKEGYSNGSWNNRVKYTTWYADQVKNSAFLTSAWCAIFVSWCADQAGISRSIIPLHAWTPSGLAFFSAKGLVTRGGGAKPGDIFYKYYSSYGRVAHTGIVEKVSGNYIYTIEGNTNTTGSSQGNGVYRLKRLITNDYYFCHPEYTSGSAKNPSVSSSSSSTKAEPKGPKLVSVVSVAHLKHARKYDPPKSGNGLGPYADEVFTLETALAKTKWLLWKYVDGHNGSATVGDGSSGYGGTTGFQVKHSGTKKPDGWLGDAELTLLFKLAGMPVKVVK